MNKVIKLLYFFSNNKALIITLILGISLASITACTTKKVDSDLLPQTVELFSRLSTTADLPSKDPEKDFSVRVSLGSSIKFVKDESFCEDQTKTKHIIISDDLAEKVLYKTSSPILLDLVLPTSIGSNMQLVNCQIGWQAVSDNAEDDPKTEIISIGNFYSDVTQPSITVVPPSGGVLSFSDLKSNTNKVTITPSEDINIVKISGNRSCIKIQNSYLKGKTAKEFEIDVSQLDSPTIGGTGDQKTTNCKLSFQDLAGLFNDQSFDITVKKPIFTASLTNTTAVYSSSAINSGRPYLEATADEDGAIYCTTASSGLDCLGGQTQISKGAPLRVPLSAMYVGTDTYIFSFVPTGAQIGSGWSSTEKITNVKYSATFSLAANIDPASYLGKTPFSVLKKRFASVPPIQLTATGANGTVTFTAGQKSGGLAECPAYAPIDVMDGVVKIRTAFDANNDSLDNKYKNGEVRSMLCIVTLTASDPSLIGSTYTVSIQFDIDRKKPIVTVVNNPLVVKIGEANAALNEFIMDENIRVVSDTCDPPPPKTAPPVLERNVGRILDQDTSKFLDYNFEDVIGGSVNCSIVFEDDVLDSPHQVPVSFAVSIIGPQNFRYTGTRTFATQSGQGSFSVDTAGYILCKNFAPASNLVGGNDNCFENPFVRVTPQEATLGIKNVNLVNLSSGGPYKYTFTMLPSPPYTTSDATTAIYKATSEALIAAGTNPLIFNVSVGKLDFTANEVGIRITSTYSGEVSYDEGAVVEACPKFTNNPFNILGTTQEIKADISNYPDGIVTTVNCKLDLTASTTPPSQASAGLNFVVDKKSPNLTIILPISNTNGRYVVLPSQIPPITGTIQMDEVGTVSSTCLSPSQINLTGTTTPINQTATINFLNSPDTTLTALSSANATVYKCTFYASDSYNNTSEVELLFEYDAPKLIVLKRSSDPKFDYELTGGIFDITVRTPVAGTKLECIKNGVSCGSVDMTGRGPGDHIMSLTNLDSGENTLTIILTYDNGKTLFDTTVVNVKNDLTFQVTGPARGSTVSTFDVNSAISFESNQDGTLSIEINSPDICFRLATPSQNYMATSPTNPTNYVGVTLPSTCQDTCTITCVLVFTQNQVSGLNAPNKARHNFSFSIDKRGIGLSGFSAKNAITSLESPNLVLTFGTQVALDPLVSEKVSLRDYYSTSSTLYDFNDSELSFNLTKTSITLNISNSDQFIRSLLKTRRVFVYIPPNKIKPVGSGVPFPGVCDNCGADVTSIDETNFYPAISINKLASQSLGDWYLTPTADLFDAKLNLNCKNHASNPEFCIGSNASSNLELHEPDSNDNIVTSTIIAGADITINHSGLTIDGSYPLYYGYSLSTADKYSNISSSKLLTSKGVVIIGPLQSTTDLTLNYDFKGLAKMFGAGKEASGVYGIRKLNENYNSPLIKVVVLKQEDYYNYASDLKYDVYALSSDITVNGVSYKAGDLDIERLFSDHPNLRNERLGVYRWNDQSGNGRDLYQRIGNRSSSTKYPAIPLLHAPGYTLLTGYTSSPTTEPQNISLFFVGKVYKTSIDYYFHRNPILSGNHHFSNYFSQSVGSFAMVAQPDNTEYSVIWAFDRSSTTQFAATLGYRFRYRTMANGTTANIASMSYKNSTSKAVALGGVFSIKYTNGKYSTTGSLRQWNNSPSIMMVEPISKLSTTTSLTYNVGDAGEFHLGGVALRPSRALGTARYDNPYGNQRVGNKAGNYVSEIIFYGTELTDIELDAVIKNQGKYFLK